ncbi:hypothetical protein [Candidatus Palauibacter sp.]|uniref:hypothetical protein n=1 Tax=Candidatus Palauibacter sp. TaxID=3101350 RepID=UPI003B5A6D5F
MTGDSPCERCGADATHPTVSVDPDQLRPFFRTSDDAAETEKLKAHLTRVQRERKPCVFLGVDDLLRIARWKLGMQYGRVERHLSLLTDELVQCVTGAALPLFDQSLSDEIVTRVRLGLLMSMPGVGMGVASAILALTLPDEYCVIDFRGWWALFSEERTHFTEAQYLRYRAGVGCLARRLSWSVQDADHALWELYDVLPSVRDASEPEESIF